MAMIIIRENIRTIFTLSRMEPPSFCASIITQETGFRKGIWLLCRIFHPAVPDFRMEQADAFFFPFPVLYLNVYGSPQVDKMTVTRREKYARVQ